MKKLKPIVSLALSASFIAMIPGCSSKTDWIMKAGDYQIGAGQYIYYVTQKTKTAQTKLGFTPSSSSGDIVTNNSKSDSKDLFKKEIEGKKADDWIKQEALKESKNMLGARCEFDNLGLSFSDDENSQNNKKAVQDYYYTGQYQHYSEVGIGQDSYKDTVIDKAKYDKVFNAYYGKDGKEAVADQDKDEYTKNHGANYKMIKIDKDKEDKSSSSSSSSDSDQKTNQQKIEDYKQEIQNGKNIDDINKEWENSKGNTSPSELSNKFIFEKDDTQAQNIIDGVFGAAQPDKEPVIKEYDDTYYIFQRYTPDQETLEKNREDALKYMKEDEFTQKLSKSADDKGFTQNDGAISKYSPQKQKSVQDKAESDANKTKDETD